MNHTHTERETVKLVAYVKSHGFEAWAAGHRWAMIAVKSVFTRNGQTFVEEETIPATRQSVRDWLGY